jgi:hypothetical protein
MPAVASAAPTPGRPIRRPHPPVGRTRLNAASVHHVIIRHARTDEHALVGELRVAAYRALGMLPQGSRYAETLRGFGFGGDCAVLVAADEAENAILGTITLEPFDPASELARDETEAEISEPSPSPPTPREGASGATCWSPPSSAPNCAECTDCGCARSRPCRPRSTSMRRPGSSGRRNSISSPCPGSPCGHTNSRCRRLATSGAGNLCYPHLRPPRRDGAARSRLDGGWQRPAPLLPPRASWHAAGPSPCASWRAFSRASLCASWRAGARPSALPLWPGTAPSLPGPGRTRGRISRPAGRASRARGRFR